MKAALRCVTAGLMILAAAACWRAAGEPQQDSSPATTPLPSPARGANEPIVTDSISHRMEEQQMRERNRDRQRRIVADTDKLVALARELREQAEASGKPLDSGEVERKAEQIEKLARSVKDRMKG